MVCTVTPPGLAGQTRVLRSLPSSHHELLRQLIKVLDVGFMLFKVSFHFRTANVLGQIVSLRGTKAVNTVEEETEVVILSY